MAKIKPMAGKVLFVLTMIWAALATAYGWIFSPMGLLDAHPEGEWSRAAMLLANIGPAVGIAAIVIGLALAKWRKRGWASAVMFALPCVWLVALSRLSRLAEMHNPI